MRNVNCSALSALDNLTTNGSQIDANQLVSASFHAYFGDATAAGTFKLQASNDICNDRYQAQIFVATNWVDLPNQTAAITSGSSAILTITSSSYRWLRAVYTATAAGVQTIAVHADVAGSLNSKYFLLNSANAGTGYYVWFNVSSGGVDPMVAGRTGVEVDIATDDTAGTVGTALAAAVDALVNFVATGTTTVTVTNAATGPWVAITDGAAPTLFTFAKTGGGTTSVNVNLNALSV